MLSIQMNKLNKHTEMFKHVQNFLLTPASKSKHNYKYEINGALGLLCAHTGWTGPGEPHEAESATSRSHRLLTIYDLYEWAGQNISFRWNLNARAGGGPREVVSTAAFHARVRGSVSSLGGLKETKMFLPHPRVKVSIVGSLRYREVACSASDRQGTNFESCVWRTVSSQSSHHHQEVLLAQFSLYVHKGGLKPDSFHFECQSGVRTRNFRLSQQAA